MAINFTPEQQKVIELRKRNILVSAAAGSGKTAVLVERIIRMITDEKHPVDIDRLLIVTFTNAAAAEMRERISLAIDRCLGENPYNLHLQKQASLLHNAQITTIDSFCLFIIRNNFNEIGLDPAFRVADEGEVRLLCQDVMRDFLEEQYQGKNPAFTQCVEYFTGGSNDKLLEEHIRRLYEFSMSCPWPEEWLSQCAEDYRITLEPLEGLEPEILETMPTAFSCNCDRKRIEKVLVSLGKEEMKDMIEEGREIEVNCQFCNRHYQFSVEELKKLYHKAG